MQSEHAEISGGDSKPVELDRFALARELGISAREGCDRFERAISRSEIQEVPGVSGELRILVAGEEDPDQLLRLRIGQALEEYTIDDAEYRAVGSDAQG